jgi:hypothetical protein
MPDRIVPAAKDINRASSCDGKVAFLTRGTAKAASERRPGRVVYKCVHCRNWHVGTPDPTPKKFTKRNKLIRLFLETEMD